MRDEQESGERVLRHRELTLEPASFQAALGKRPLRLTKREFEILFHMLSFPSGRIFSRRELAQCGWPGGAGGKEESVYVHIFHIRKKIWDLCGEEYIETIRGYGFCLK